MAQVKPVINSVWGSTGATTDPGTTKMNLGWTAEIPTHNVQNFWQQRADEMLTHLNEQGIAEWDAVTTYPVDAWAKGSDGEVYRAIDSSTGEDPTSSPTEWTLNITANIDGNNVQGQFTIGTDGSLTQSGEVAITSTSEAVTFPVSFGNDDVKIALTVETTGVGGVTTTASIIEGTITTSGFTASTDASHTQFHWIAKGVV